jgi:hypothetical protein
MVQPLGLVYLVWGPLGVQPLRDFLAAYLRCAAGTEHELIVAFNGVAREHGPEHGPEHEHEPAGATRAAFLRELDSVPHRLLELQHPVLDLPAYFQLASQLEHQQLCFLNSYSEPLVDGWLALLEQAADAPDVGMVGATASWASQASHVRFLVGLGGPYARVYGDRERTKQLFAPPSTPAAESPAVAEPSPGALQRGREKLAAARLLARQLSGFPAFPAPHLRSNAFLLGRELMRSIRTGPLPEKTDTYLLESGRHSLTRQIERMGQSVLVAGRDGATYAPREWAHSRTFWQGAQENLIVADNQTRSYEHANSEVRRMLSVHAWGELAAPAEPDPSARATLTSYGGTAPQAG